MTQTNPYAPPQFNETGSPSTAISGVQAHFPVSPTKFVVMFIGTFGLYGIHWFERQWRFQQQATGESMMPLARGLFSIFFAHKLFRLIAARAQALAMPMAWNPESQATTYVVLALVANLGGRVVPAMGLLWLGCIFPLLTVQRTVNEILHHDCPGLDMNERFTPANIVWLVIAGLLWFFAITGFVGNA